MFRAAIGARITTGCLAVVLAAPAAAGVINLTWDPVSNATGYRVYYGSASGQYSRTFDAGNSTQAILTGLDDCSTWYVAVKAYNPAGESAQYSNEVTGWPRPELGAGAPTAAMQGESFTMSIPGANFQDGARIDVTSNNPRVLFQTERVISCRQIEVSVSVDPAGPGLRPAAVGTFDLDIVVTNPDQVYQESLQSIQVLVNPARFDVNRRDPTTDGRLDGFDTVTFSRAFGGVAPDTVYDPDHDFDGDGVVGGDDLALMAGNFGLCWSGTAWTLEACPPELQ